MAQELNPVAPHMICLYEVEKLSYAMNCRKLVPLEFLKGQAFLQCSPKNIILENHGH